MELSSEDLHAFADSVADVVATRCNRSKLHEHYDGRIDLARSIWTTAAELGWIGIALPTRCGGLGAGAPGLDILFRQLGRFAVPGAFLSTLVGAQWLSQQAEEQIVDRTLAEIIAGKLTLAIPAIPGRQRVALRNGRIEADSPLLIGPLDARMAIIPIDDDDRAAYALVECGERHTQLNAHPLWDHTREMCSLRCEGVEPLLRIADIDGRATKLLRRFMAIALAAECVGGAREIASQTVAYLKDRQQFGRSLASFQALKHRVADLHVAVVEAEQALDQAVEAAATDAASADMWAALAKAAAAECFHFVATDSMQLHGGVGYTWELDCHVHLKRALLARELCGNASAMRDLAAADLQAATRSGVTTAEFAA